MRKRFSTIIISLLMIISIAVAGIGCAGNIVLPSSGGESDKTTTSSNELQILKSDFQMTAEQKLSRIKAEYLIENNGYKSDDKVVAILSVEGNALIDDYLDGTTDFDTVADYAASTLGKKQTKAIKKTQNAIIKTLKSKKLIDNVNYQYTTVLNGIAVETSYKNLDKLSSVKGVKNVSLADTYNRPQAASGSVGSTVVNAVDVYETGIFNSSTVSYTGKRTAVAILDSGFDCSHSVFDHELKNDELWITQSDVTKVLPQTRAAGFTQGLKLSDVWYSNKIPFVYDYADKDYDVFPYDSNHGTHVAGIIGGKDDVITGIAVDTQLVLLKVFPDLNEGAETDDILAGLEDAMLLGVDAINMSLGSSCGFAREEDGNVINDVYDKLYESGISLVTAASNSYSSGYGGEQGNTNLVTNPDSGTVGSPSTYAGALSVASISGTKSHYLVCNDEDVVFFLESNSVTGDPNDFFAELYASLGKEQSETLELEYVTVPGVGLRINYTAISGIIKGKIALVRRGDSTFEDKALQAKNAGAIACIIYNNVDGDINMSMGKTDHIPTISISKDDGTKLASLSTGKITIKGSNDAGPFMSDFSSWGPSPNLELKPEITAHGGNIRSSVPGGGYDELSGTSMASPNLCGIVVLIRQYLKDTYPDLDANQITVLANQLMMSTATIVLNEQGNPYSPRKQGAGLASLYNVVNTRAYLTVDGKDMSKIELKDDPQKTGKYTMEFNLVNLSNEKADYDFSLVGMTESVSTSDASHVSEKGQILSGGYELSGTGAGSVNGNSVTVNAGGTLKLKAVYTLTDGDKDLIDRLFPYGMYVEGFCKLTAKGEDDIDLNIPFLAYYGDWLAAPMFDKTYYEVESEAHNGAIDDDEKIKADYYATTPYGSYYYNYIIPLGSYVYDMDESIYDPIPASADRIAVSDQLASIDGISMVYAGLLRNAKEMYYTITDKTTGEVIWSDTDYNANKAYSVGGTPVPYYHSINVKGAESEYTSTGIRDSKFLGLVNNREYEFKMQGILDYGNGGLVENARNSFAFDFTADTQAPIIKSAEYEKTYDRSLKKDRYYVTLTVYDNQYVQSISPIVFTSTESYTELTRHPIPVYGEKGADTKVRIEITDYLDNLYSDAVICNAISFHIDDYALNTQIYTCQLPGTRGEFKFTNDGEPDGVELYVKGIDVGEVFDLTSLLSTADGTVDEGKDYLKFLDWSSSNEDIVTVKEGQVVGIKPGRAVITAIERMDGRRASIIVNVRDNGETETNELSVELSDETAATDLSTPAAAMGESGGAVALSENHAADSGKVPIESVRFSYFDTLFAYSRAAQTSEIGKTGDRIYTTSLGGVLNFYPGESIKLNYEIKPWYVEDRYPVTFTSTNEDIVKVEQDGTVTALKEGNATVTMHLTGSNLMATINLHVNNEFVIENRMLVAYKGLGGHVEIPDDEGILYIGAYAFCLYDTDRSVEINEDDYDANKIPLSNTAITSVTIPDGVEDIQKYAFYNCTNLREVSIPDSVKFVREFAFYDAEELTTINLDKVETIGARAFYGCTKLKNVDLEHAIAIGIEAFYGSGITSADLTALRNTGARAFSNCASLERVTLGEHTKLSTAMFALSGLEKVDIYETVAIPDSCFARCDNLEEVVIHNPLVSIGDLAFCQSPKLRKVEFLGSVGSFGIQVFYNCTALTSIKLPGGDVVLYDYVMYDCESLEELILAPTTHLVYVGGAVFGGTNLQKFTLDPDEGSQYYDVSSDGTLLMSKDGKTVVLAAMGHDFGDYTLPDGIRTIGAGAFAGANITKITITYKYVTIGEAAFMECVDLKDVVLPVEKGLIIGDYAFYNSGIESVENLEFAIQIGAYAFSTTSALKSAHIGAGVTLIEGAFWKSGIQQLTLENGVQITDAAFRDCSSLTTVTINGDNSLVHFGYMAFYNCPKLMTIDLTKADRVIGGSAFYNCAQIQRAELTNVTEIGDYAFADCSSLYTLIMPIVKTIGEGAFTVIDTDSGSAPSFVRVTLPSTLETLGDGAFLGCMNLQEVIFEDGCGVTEIPDYAFGICASLTSINLPSTVKKIGDYSFYSCENLEYVALGAIKEIGASAFENATYLGYGFNHQIDLSSAETIGDKAFYATYSGGYLSAPKLKSIGNYAFYGTYFSALSAPVLETIGDGAFRLNVTVTEFTFSDKLSHVGIVAFLGCNKLESFYFGTGENKTDTAEINEYAFLESGVLYTHLPSGAVQLTAVAPAMNMRYLTVKDGTEYIGVYAANANTNIRGIVLPDSLKSIGGYAFYGCTALRDVEFRSSVAPTLESTYNINDDLINMYESRGYAHETAVSYAQQHPLWKEWYSTMYNLAENAPGFELLHSQFDIFGEEYYYYTFIDLVGAREPLMLTLPANDTLYGYDGIIYEAYFGKVEDAFRSSYVARDKSLVEFVDYANKIMQIDTVTIADEDLVSKAVIAYYAITQDATDFGYAADEWANMVKSVMNAREIISDIKVANAPLVVRNVQRMLDELPEKFSEDMIELLEAATAKISTLRSDERALLDTAKYDSLVSAYEKWKEGGGGTEDEENPGKTGLTAGQLAAAIAVPIAVVLAAGAAVAVILILRKKKEVK